MAALGRGAEVERRPDRICPTAADAPNPQCPMDPCLSGCGTGAELWECCVRTHGLPLDEAGALCVAQAFGMPVGIDECKVRFEAPHWVVDTIVEPAVGWRYRIRAADGALGSRGYVHYNLVAP